MKRRDFLKAAAGAATATTFAGCASDLEGDSENDTPTTTQDPETTTEDQYDDITYEIDLSIDNNEIDLSDAYDAVLEEYSFEELAEFTEEDWENAWKTVHNTETGLRDQDYTQLQYTLTEYLNDEEQGEAEPGTLTLDVTGENGEHHSQELELGPETDNAYEIDCTELYNGENQVELTAEVDGEKVTDTVTITKKIPEAHLIEAIVDGEQITAYNSPYTFDTHQMDTEQFHKQRTQAVEEGAKDGILHHIDQERLNQEVLENEDLTEKERKELAIKSVGIDSRDLIGNSSEYAEKQAMSEEIGLRHFTDYDEIYANGFDNPAAFETTDESGNHGSKAFYLDGDWYHSDTINPEVAPTTNLEHISMVSGSNQDFVSVLAEFHEGEMEEIPFHVKMSRLNGFYGGQFGVNMNTGAAVTDKYGSTGLELIRDNVNREKIMAPIEAAATFGIENDRYTSIMGTPETPVLLASKEGKTVGRIWNEKDFQDVGTVLAEAMG